MTDKMPIGVFVRLPLTGEQFEAVDGIAKEIAENNAENEWRFARHYFSACDTLVIALGDPVKDQGVPIVAYANPEETAEPIGDQAAFFEVADKCYGYLKEPLVRHSDAQAAIAAAQAENKMLRTALAFYADPVNWIDTPPWDGDLDCITPKAIPILDHGEDGRPCDCGDTAREALKKACEP